MHPRLPTDKQSVLKLRDAPGATTNTSVAPDGLDAARQHARRQSKRRRRSGAIKNGLVGIILLGVLAAAGYVGWEAYQDSREQTEIDGQFTPLTPNDAIDRLEDQPRWNGPGNPTFGVGDEP